MRRVLIALLMVVMACCFMACEETEEGVDNENDIIVRNFSEQDLWVAIDGIQRGRIENDGIAETMWDDIPDGIHVLQAFLDDAYTALHCQVDTTNLDDAEDFRWYLMEDNEYEGTREGDC